MATLIQPSFQKKKKKVFVENDVLYLQLLYEKPFFEGHVLSTDTFFYPFYTPRDVKKKKS